MGEMNSETAGAFSFRATDGGNRANIGPKSESIPRTRKALPRKIKTFDVSALGIGKIIIRLIAR